MAFTEAEIAEHLSTVEREFWANRRPPLDLRDQIREGQRFKDQSIELFLVRPAYNRPGEQVEESLAKVSFIRSTGLWRIFWKRADGKWHRYPSKPEANSLAEALGVIQNDKLGCFFG